MFNLGLRRDCSWEFTVADIPHPIIGTDLLSHYGLLIDLRERRLIDSITKIQTFCILKISEINSISLIDQPDEYASILNEFPKITSLQPTNKILNGNTVHQIITTGYPIAQPARRICPEKCKTAKELFQEMIKAGATFQRYIFKALGDISFVFAHIDDILIASKTKNEHKKHLPKVFQRLKDFGLRINISKCQFGGDEIEFLGFVVNEHGCKPTSEKTETILNWPKPNTKNDLRRWLGLVNFYRRSMPHAAMTQAPLHAHLRDARKNDKRRVQCDAE